MPSPVFDTIKAKRAVRTFTDEPLSDEVVERILDAGRRSGSAKNMQPWQFIAVRNREVLEALSACGKGAWHLAGAGLGVALVTPDPFYRLSVPFDLGRTTQNMMLAAWEMGVGSVMATIYWPDRARAALGVPPDHTIPWCISFGYPAEPQDRPARKGGRQGLADVVHYETW
jgi:nitroreductase